MRNWSIGLLIVLIATFLVGVGQEVPKESTVTKPLLVAAASDLKGAFEQIGKEFTAQTGIPVTYNFGSSGKLAAQIREGAPVDIFASAHEDFIEDLIDAGLLRVDSKRLYAYGFLSIAMPSRFAPWIKTFEDLQEAGVAYIAVANPTHAPYGELSTKAIKAAGYWDGLQPKLVFADNIAHALQLVASGNAEAGLIATSLKTTSPDMVFVPVDLGLYQPLPQAMGIAVNSLRQEEARRFEDFVTGEKGRAILASNFFGLPE